MNVSIQYSVSELPLILIQRHRQNLTNDAAEELNFPLTRQPSDKLWIV